jgi:hypothetical protein
MLVRCGLVKLLVKTFPGSGHHGLIAGRATEATARALCVPAPRAGHEGTTPGGPGLMAWAVGQAASNSAGPGRQAATHCARGPSVWVSSH